MLLEHRSARNADLAYLRLLHLAASTMESEVEAALDVLHEAGEVPDYDAVKALVEPGRTEAPALIDFEPHLEDYDALLEVGR